MNKRIVLMALIGMLVLVACQTPSPTPAAVIEATSTATAVASHTPIVVLETPTASTETPTAEPTASAEPTATVVAAPAVVQAALDAAWAHAREQYPQQVPAAETSWTADIIDQHGLVGVGGYLFVAGDWQAVVTYPIVAPNLMVYRIQLTNAASGFAWQGEVSGQGQVAEVRGPSGGSGVEQVEGLIGVVYALPDMAQFDDYFEADGERFGIDAAEPQLAAQLAALRDTGQMLKVWGALERGVMDVNGAQLRVSRFELVDAQPTTVDGWVGTIVALPAGNQFGDYFLREDGEQFDIGATDPAIEEALAAYRQAGDAVRVWGMLLVGVPAVEARHIDVSRLEPVAIDDPDAVAFADWVGQIVKLPAGSQHGQVFLRQDGETFSIGTTVGALQALLQQAAWSGAQIRIAGSYYAISQHVEVARLDTITDGAAEARNLSPFATAQASSQLASDSYGMYAAGSAIDGFLSTPWVEGVDGPGIGQWIRLTFPAPVRITALGLDVGYDRDLEVSSVKPEFFERNNRIKRVTITYGGGQQMSWTAQDARGIQSFPVTVLDLVTDEVLVTIEEVYPGSQYDDTCLAELQVWGWVD